MKVYVYELKFKVFYTDLIIHNNWSRTKLRVKQVKIWFKPEPKLDKTKPEKEITVDINRLKSLYRLLLLQRKNVIE